MQQLKVLGILMMFAMIASTLLIAIPAVDANGGSSGSPSLSMGQNASATSDPSPHPPIIINGNSEFTAANGVVSGSGTATDPYVIENWLINASAADGISISNATAFFVVENCEVYDGSLNPILGALSNDGITLDNVSNGLVYSCSFLSDGWGISLTSSSDNTLTNNTCSNNNYNGIYLTSSSDNAITNNTCNNNNFYCGIELYNSSSNNILTNNTCNNEYSYGILLLSSSNSNTCSGNTCSNNPCGITLESSSNSNTLTNNICNNDNYGIYSYYSSDNDTLQNNEIYNNSYGVYIDSSVGTEIHYCNIYNNGNYGIYNDETSAVYVVNATYCWWGSSSGPSGAGSGSGDAVSSNALYSPWLTSLGVSPTSSFNVSAAPTSMTAVIGSSANYTISIDNFGNSPDTFTINVVGLNSSWCSLSGNPVNLSAGAADNVSLEVAIPKDSSVAGVYPFDVTVTDSSGVKASVSLELNATYISTYNSEVNFTEKGLPANTVWYVKLGNNLTSTTKIFITFYNVTNSTNWSADSAIYTNGNTTRYVTSQSNGSIMSSTESITISYQKQYYLNESTISRRGQILPGSGWYDAGTRLTISAKSPPGYKFDYWTGSGVGSYSGTKDAAGIKLNSPITELAVFVKSNSRLMHPLKLHVLPPSFFKSLGYPVTMIPD